MKDAALKICDALALTTTEPVYSSSIDLGVARDIAPGHPLVMVFTFSTAVTFNTSTSVTIQAVTSTAADLLTATEVVGEQSLLVAADLDGTQTIYVRINPDVIDRSDEDLEGRGQRYLGARFVTNDGADLTAGVCNAYLTTIVDNGKTRYASGWSVL